MFIRGLIALLRAREREKKVFLTNTNEDRKKEGEGVYLRLVSLSGRRRRSCWNVTGRRNKFENNKEKKSLSFLLYVRDVNNGRVVDVVCQRWP